MGGRNSLVLIRLLDEAPFRTLGLSLHKLPSRMKSFNSEEIAIQHQARFPSL